MMLKSWLLWSASAGVCAALGASVFSAACNGEIIDEPPIDAGFDAPITDSGDAGTMDASEIKDVASVDVEQPTLETFLSLTQNATCERYRDCCVASGYDGGPGSSFNFTGCAAQFTTGWSGTAIGATTAIARDAGNLEFDPSAALECLRLVRTFECPEITGTEMGRINDTCAAALAGKGQSGSACAVSLECARGLYCEIPGGGGLGTCAPLPAADAGCDYTYNSAANGVGYTAEQCSYLGRGAACELVDPNDEAKGQRCGSATNPNGTVCSTHQSCASKLCSIEAVNAAVCVNRTTILLPSLPGPPPTPGTCESFTIPGDAGH